MVEIIVATISAAAVVIAAVVGLGGRYLGSMRKLLTEQAGVIERVRAQVENSHSTNLREEQDDRHRETTRAIERVADAVNETRLDIGGMRSELRGVHERATKQDERLQRMSSTVIRIIEQGKQ